MNKGIDSPRLLEKNWLGRELQRELVVGSSIGTKPLERSCLLVKVLA